MHHGPAAKLGKDNASPAKTKLGIILFIFYSMVYVGFVAINTISPVSMEMEIMLGLNLAVVYGLGLIVLAIVMGLIYNRICTGYEDRLNQPAAKQDGSDS